MEEQESPASAAPSVYQSKQPEPQAGHRYSPRDSYTPTEEPERYSQTKPTGTGRQSAAEGTNRLSPSMEMGRFSPIEPESRPAETDIPYDPASGGDYVRRENRSYDPDQVSYDPASGGDYMRRENRTYDPDQVPYDPASGGEYVRRENRNYDPDQVPYDPAEVPYDPAEGAYDPAEGPNNPDKEIEGIPLNIPPRVRQGHIYYLYTSYYTKLLLF